MDTGLPVYLGDEVSAAGWRIAGARVLTPAAGDAAAALAGACAESPLVLVSAALASKVDEATMQRLLAAVTPLVVVVPDLDGEAAMPDLAARIRDELGMQA